MSQHQVQLKVLEAYTRDVGRGVARLDYAAMDALGASTGDVVEVEGERRTVAKCLPLYPSDEGRGVVRIDGLIRNNGGVASHNATPSQFPHMLSTDPFTKEVGAKPGDFVKITRRSETAGASVYHRYVVEG